MYVKFNAEPKREEYKKKAVQHSLKKSQYIKKEDLIYQSYSRTDISHLVIYSWFPMTAMNIDGCPINKNERLRNFQLQQIHACISNSSAHKQ
jgi:hypothetical protein